MIKKPLILIRFNELKHNDDKSKFLFLRSRFRHLLSPPTISVGMENISASQQVRFLTTRCHFHHMLNKIVKGAFYHIRNISKIRKYISKSIAEILIHILLARCWTFVILFFLVPKNGI